MTEIERKALALVNEVRAERGRPAQHTINRKDLADEEALCRVIEQHEAFKQEVSDAVEDYCGYVPPDSPCHPITRFIIPKPVDPLVEALQAVDEFANPTWVEHIAPQLRAALAARGLEIRSKTDG